MTDAIRRPLRVWPAVVIAILQLLVRFGLPIVAPDQRPYAILGGFAAMALILVWWLLFSRAPWVDRVLAVLLMAAGVWATKPFIDKSLATGAQGLLFYILVIPGLSLVFAAWAVAARRLPDTPRRATMIATILIACGFWTLMKTGGFTATLNMDLKWRWAQTPEDRLLQSAKLPIAPPAAQPVTPAPPVSAPKTSEPKPAKDAAVIPAAAAATETGPDWPGFRGLHRDDIVPGVKIKTDWTATPPVAIWRRPVGPGWSSFAVHGGLIYTQEQRGPDEVVACYKLATGEPVWAHLDTARFWESNAGAGPRATPTLANGRVYTFGATGIVNVLNAQTGAVIWSHNAAADTGMKTPTGASPVHRWSLTTWSSSPRPAAWRPTIAPPACAAGWVPPAVSATVRRGSSPSMECGRSYY